jgi:predicted AlkP superfamily pyrophosphatase or phosphodiesterase
MKVLTVFIDGLKPESIEFMPFMNSLNKRRIKTELGYSNPCHASMYCGVYPNKHLIWFIWRYSPETSPFKWLKKSRLDKIPQNIYIKYILYKISKLFYKNNSSAFGLPFLWYMPLNKWSYFDVTEKKFWDEDKYLKNYYTIFEILRNAGLDYEIVGLDKRALNKSIESIKNHRFSQLASWTYLFIGDIDPLSHKYGQRSSEVIIKLQEIDNILAELYDLYEKESNDFCFMLFSDHGHTLVNKKVDLHSLFKSQGNSLNDYIYFIDSNFARFWCRNEKEKEDVSRILSNINIKGFILTESTLKKYHVNMPDNSYGDLIFYLDPPYIFDQGNIFVLGKERSDTGSYISFHGFLPDFPDSDGVFISNKQLINKEYIELVDVLPSILFLFELQIPSYIDGKVIWK